MVRPAFVLQNVLYLAGILFTTIGIPHACALPDFAIWGISATEAPLSSPARNIVDIEVQVRNIGDTAGDGGTLAVWGNMPLIISNDMHGEISTEVGIIQPGQTKKFTFNSFFAKFIQPGTNAVRAFVDVSNQTEEVHEYNNQTYVRHVADPWGSGFYPSGKQVSLLESSLLAYYCSLPETNIQDRLTRMDPVCSPYVTSGELPECPDYETMLTYDFFRTYYRLKQCITNGATNLNVWIAVVNKAACAASNVHIDVWFDHPGDVSCGDRGDFTSLPACLPPRTGAYFTYNKTYTGEVKEATFCGFIDSTCLYDETSEDNNVFRYTYVITNRTSEFKFSAFALTNSTILRWTDPKLSGMKNTAVQIRCNSVGYPATTNDGTLLYTGTNRMFEHTGMTPGAPCYYTIWVTHNGIWFVEPPD